MQSGIMDAAAAKGNDAESKHQYFKKNKLGGLYSQTSKR